MTAKQLINSLPLTEEHEEDATLRAINALQQKLADQKSNPNKRHTKASGGEPLKKNAYYVPYVGMVNPPAKEKKGKHVLGVGKVQEWLERNV